MKEVLEFKPFIYVMKNVHSSKDCEENEKTYSDDIIFIQVCSLASGCNY